MNAFNILTLEGYFNRFAELRKTMKCKDAYDILEKELADNYGVYRYSSFESFESGLYRWNHFAFKQIP